MKRVLAALVVALTLAACGGDSKVGDDALLNVKDQIPKDRLGAATTTTAGPSTTAGSANLGIRNTTTRPPVATTIPEIVIAINGDRSGGTQFEPNNATVYPNFVVRWNNKDTVARSVVFDDGTKRSPSIPPGGSWSTTFAKPGTYTYQDGTRPYAVGSVTVVAR